MGQAKARGTYEERVASATVLRLERQKAELAAEVRARQERRALAYEERGASAAAGHDDKAVNVDNGAVVLGGRRTGRRSMGMGASTLLAVAALSMLNR